MPETPTRHRRTFLTAALALGIATAACGGSGTTESSLKDRTFSALVTPPAAPDVAGGVCLDETPSIDRAIPEQARRLLVERLARWVPARGPEAEGSPAVPGLELLVRKVTPDTVALGVDGLVSQVAIPAVPAIAPAPGPVPNLLQLQAQHRKQVETAEAARGKASAAAADAVGALNGADLSSPESEIRGCVEALARAMPKGAFLLVSDLEQYGVPQVGVASLKDVTLIIVHACRTAATCVDQRAAWTAMFADAGGTPPVFLTVENMAKAFDQLFSAAAR